MRCNTFEQCIAEDLRVCNQAMQQVSASYREVCEGPLDPGICGMILVCSFTISKTTDGVATLAGRTNPMGSI
jgi:hypothetical protein